MKQSVVSHKRGTWYDPHLFQAFVNRIGKYHRMVLPRGTNATHQRRYSPRFHFVMLFNPWFERVLPLISPYVGWFEHMTDILVPSIFYMGKLTSNVMVRSFVFLMMLLLWMKNDRSIVVFRT